jgi:hypothetical protein
MKRKKLLSTKKVDIRNFPTSSSTSPAIYNIDIEPIVTLSGNTTASGTATRIKISPGEDIQDILSGLISLQEHGDKIEQENYEFISENFPKYEQWWKVNVVPLTNRYSPTYPNIHFKSDGELGIIGKGYSDIMLAQMSYTVLIHLLRLKTLLDEGIGENSTVSQDRLYEFFSRASALIDVALDFIVLRKEQGFKDILDGIIEPKLSLAQVSERKIKSKLRDQTYNSQILDYSQVSAVRKYRHSLLHGIVPPTYDGQYPLIGTQNRYEDWRTVTSSSSINKSEFAYPQNICEDAFQIILDFLDKNW